MAYCPRSPQTPHRAEAVTVSALRAQRERGAHSGGSQEKDAALARVQCRRVEKGTDGPPCAAARGDPDLPEH